MTVFVLINWLLCLISSISLAIVLWRSRFLFIKPSMMVIFFFHLRIQWAATINSDRVETYLPEPVSFAFLVHGFTLIGLFLSIFIMRRNTKKLWYRITDNYYAIPGSINRAVLVLLGFITVIVFWYLSNVSIWKTGLFTIFFNPEYSAQAREESLKLLSNIPLRYAYSFLNSTFALLLAALIALLLAQSLKQRRIVKSSIYVFIIICVLFLVSFSGARSPSAVIILLIILLFYLKKGLPLKPVYLLISCITVLTIPVLLSIFREGQEFNILNYFQYLFGSIFKRVFVLPMYTGLYHVHYAQTFGFFGIAGIPKIAYLFGIPPVNPANIIYLQYSSWSLQSGLANTCYVFSYYSYFGLISFVFSLLGLWLLDLSILIYNKLSNRFLLPCIASVLIASLSFVAIDYTTVLLTQGFGLLLILSWTLDQVCRIRILNGSLVSTFKNRKQLSS